MPEVRAMLEFVFAVLALGAVKEAPEDPRGTLRLQVLLDRAHCSPGEIDGKSGSNTTRALGAFEKRAGLPVGPAPDEAAWTALEAATGQAPALVEYTLTAEDLAGPFAPIPEDMMEKAKLAGLGYVSAVEALGERFHASPALLQALNPGIAFDTPGQAIRVPNVHSEAPAVHADRVVVDGDSLSVSALDAEGKVIAYYPATIGGEHDPLPVGQWKIQGVAKNPPFFYNPELFWDADESHAKAKIPAGPNNPVGVVWIELSCPKYGIHGTPEPSTVGKTQSHGCVRLTNWDAAELAQLVKPGTPALLQRDGR
jgi:lipoprotein-anchoring transpeptidase ErfK/SrfK